MPLFGDIIHLKLAIYRVEFSRDVLKSLVLSLFYRGVEIRNRVIEVFFK
ncbi:MAG: hypothetical protein PWP54_1642 [Thermosipho sp. (in: thermotogales)]|jgi:hypothetical protein|nr:hypothetical protein [Thermosipho sp. (in: thermotogales)]MDK2887062.1 hypothetical protein [Thermosipho sp. (in: thermotogales)]